MARRCADVIGVEAALVAAMREEMEVQGAGPEVVKLLVLGAEGVVAVAELLVPVAKSLEAVA